MKVKVIKEFHDKNNFGKLYKVGDEVEGFDKTRAANLVKYGLVENLKATKTPKEEE